MPNPLNISDAEDLTNRKIQKVYLKNGRKSMAKKIKIPTDTGYMLHAKEFLKKPWYKQIFTKEFVREVPGATAEVLGAPFSTIGKAIKAGVKRINQPASTLSPEELRLRKENLERMRESIKKYLERHPGYKVPKEFKGLIK